MKTKSNSRSAFAIPRVVLGFAFCSTGVLLALAALNKSGAETPVPKNLASQPGTWTATGSMSTARWFFTATLLRNGKVLVAGGGNRSGVTSGAELYDPHTGLWTPTGSMSARRSAHTATLLPDGKVLVAGGSQETTATSTAELYDPSTGIWTPTGSMTTPRASHMATLITTGPLSGMVLAAGGSSVCGGCTPILASAELYNPTTGMWTPTGSMNVARYFESLSPTTLPDGSILIVGGTTCCPYHWLNQAESFDPISQTWTPTSMKVTDANEETVLLPNGLVLVAGGVKGTQPTNRNVSDAELFDSVLNTWSAAPDMSIDRQWHQAILLQSGEVLVAGGNSGGWDDCTDVRSSELYDPSTGIWSPAGEMVAARSQSYRAILLPNGQVLAMGGRDCELNILSSAELYTPLGCTPPPAGLVSWWPGDGNANDIKDGNNGTLQNGATFASGMVGQAFGFDGVDDYVQISDDASLNPGTSDFSVDFWMNTDTSGVDVAVLNKREACGPVSFWSINMAQDGRLGVEVRQTGETNNNTFSSDISVNDGTWHHVALVRQTTTATLYIDGAVHGSGSTQGITIVANTAPVLFANDVCVGFGREVYRGELDEIEYLNVALTSSQVQDIYNASSAGKCKPIPRPITVTFNTNPSGLSYRVDGTTFNSAHVFSWPSGSSHTISTTSPQSGGSGVRYVWQSWSDNGARSHTIAPTTSTAYTATFATQYHLTMNARTGGTVMPASGWKNKGAQVTIRATPSNGYHFTGWTGSGNGSYSGTNNPASVTMNGPITETASFSQ